MNKLLKLFSLLLCGCLFLNSCSTKFIPPKRLLPEKTLTLQEFDYTNFSPKQLLVEIKALNKILSGKNIPEKEYESILNRLEILGRQMKMFEALKFNRSEASFTIPANSKTTFKFKSYCLNPHGGSPASNEQFVLRSKAPKIALYKDIMIYSNSSKEFKSLDKQLLLWNLKNDVKFETLPLNQQAFLLKMDPMSYLKVNNYITSELKSQLTKFAQTQVPFYNQVTDTIKLVQGKAYTYEEYASNIQNLASKVGLIDNTAPIKADGYDIFTQTQSSGFGGTTITFVNTNPLPIAITCTAFLDPLRNGVQPIGFDMPEIFEEYEKYKDDILKEIDQLILNLTKKPIFNLNIGDLKSIEDNINNKFAIAYFSMDTASAIFTTEMIFGGKPSHDEGDAFRHAFWSALLTRDVGTKLAEEFLANHELPPEQEVGRVMDLHNNRIGREIGEELSRQGKYLAKDYIDAVFANKDKLQVDVKTGKWGRWWAK